MLPERTLSAKEQRLVAGLARAVGLEDAPSTFVVLKYFSETLLGATVGEDGEVHFAEEEVPARKRKRSCQLAEEAAPEEVDAAEGEEPAEGETEEEGGEEGGEGDDGGGGGDDDDEEEEEEEEEEEGDGDEEYPEEELLAMEAAPRVVDDPISEARALGEVIPAGGTAVFRWLIAPLAAESFEALYQEAKPLLVRRPSNPGYYDGLLSSDDIRALLRDRPLRYAFNVDVAHYKDGKRVNFNYNGDAQPAGAGDPEVADPAVVWARHAAGASVRVLHPQRWVEPLWRLVSRLEDHLQCPVGCNAYLTPPSSQGFAPHFDDVDVYILQLEGEKRWRLTAPTARASVLPRYPSKDFEPEELGQCVFDEVLRPGELLYLPRGTTHQAETGPGGHSLHLTISAGQGRSWAAFLAEALPRAVELAAHDSTDMRRSLPRLFGTCMGVMHQDEDEEEEEEGDWAYNVEREAFKQAAAGHLEAIIEALPMDAVADQWAVRFLKGRMPPVLEPPPGPPPKLGEASRVRLVAPRIARLVVEASADDAVAAVYHCLANERGAHAGRAASAEPGTEPLGEEAEGPGRLEFPLEDAALLEVLVRTGEPSPDPLVACRGRAVAVAELPGEPGRALAVAQRLADAGLLVEAGPEEEEQDRRAEEQRGFLDSDGEGPEDPEDPEDPEGDSEPEAAE